MRLDNLEIVLVGTRHAGNIGSVARLMKNMGLSRLILIDPSIHRHLDAIKMASGAEDLIESASVFSNLADGLKDSTLVIGTTSRTRRLRREVISPVELVRKTSSMIQKNRVSVLFGPENFGLNNNDMRLCQHLVNIPTTKERQSINLAQAVGIIAYEFCKTVADPINGYERLRINNEKKNLFYSRLENLLQKIGFLETAHPDRSMASVRDLFDRAGMDRKDFNLMMGILKELERKLNPN